MFRKHKRTRLWVDGPFQSRLLLRVCGYFLIYFLLVVHIGFAFRLMAYRIGPSAPGAPQGLLGIYLDYLGQQKLLLVAMVLTAPAFLYDLLKLSHRIAGPLYRCRAVMRDMAAGKPVREFVPRKHDLVREFVESFNRLIRAWNARGAAPAAGPPAAAANGAPQGAPPPARDEIPAAQQTA
jgi:hypothetical protein